MKLTKELYSNAIKSEKILDDALTALGPITLETLGGDTELRSQLDDLCAALEGTRLNHQVVIESGEAAKNSVDPVLINRCLERIDELQGRLKLKNGELERMNNAYDVRLRDAVAAGVPIDQFRPIDAAPGPENEVRIARELALLNLEIERIHAFLATVPFFDYRLLAGTALEKYIPGETA